jgi:hypothetical protein
MTLDQHASDAVPFVHRILSSRATKLTGASLFWRVRRSVFLRRLLGGYLLFGQLQQ